MRVVGTGESDTVLELATGDDGGAGESIHFRGYNTSNGISYDVTVPKKTGTIALTSDIPTSLPASDVYAWAKAPTKPTYTKSEVGLGNVDNTADANKNVNYATTSHLLRTYSAGNSSHGEDYYLKCRHNVDGNDKFKLQIVRSDGSVTHATSVDYANEAGSATNSQYLSTAAMVNGCNTSTYPWRRIMSIPATTYDFSDTVGTYYLAGNYYGAPYYLFRVEFRTNHSSGGAGGSFAISVIATNSDPNDLAIASYSVATNGVTTSYSDIFVKTNYGWPRMSLTRLSAPRGSISYYNSNEDCNASSRTEAYIGINGSGTGYASYELHSLAAYTNVTFGRLTAGVNYANSAGSVA